MISRKREPLARKMRKIYVQAARSTRHTTPQQQQHMQHSTEQQDEKRSENEKRSEMKKDPVNFSLVLRPGAAHDYYIILL